MKYQAQNPQPMQPFDLYFLSLLIQHSSVMRHAAKTFQQVHHMIYMSNQTRLHLKTLYALLSEEYFYTLPYTGLYCECLYRQ